MGYGNWSTQSFADYSTRRGYDYDTATGSIKGSYSAQEMFKSRRLEKELDPAGVMRECRDSDEHPHSRPVILALDVTGSMGDVSVKVAKSLNNIMEELYKSVEDVEFMIMGIGDLDYDMAPIQASQFESDIRIAESLDKIYFEGGGGGNGFESYTAAWYFGLNNCDLDCWKRGEKGTIITLGDEPLNPYLPNTNLKKTLGISGEISLPNTTETLYKQASEKYNIYHVAVNDDGTSYNWYKTNIEKSWGALLGHNFYTSTLNALPMTISEIVKKSNSHDNFIDSPIVMENNDIIRDSDGIGW